MLWLVWFVGFCYCWLVRFNSVVIVFVVIIFAFSLLLLICYDLFVFVCCLACDWVFVVMVFWFARQFVVAWFVFARA